MAKQNNYFGTVFLQETSGAKTKVKLKAGGEVKDYKSDLVTQVRNWQPGHVKQSDLIYLFFLPQVNPPKFDMCEDMSGLTYLNDASVLWNLTARYVEKLIYVSLTHRSLKSSLQYTRNQIL